MIEYKKEILKDIKKGKIPEKIFLQIHHCLQAVEKIGDLSIFDIKKIKGDYQYTYYRLRKGKYRVIFYFEDSNIKVIALEHRREVYRKWES
jgi:mRNA interferase RelE/StbE